MSPFNEEQMETDRVYNMGVSVVYLNCNCSFHTKNHTIGVCEFSIILLFWGIKLSEVTLKEITNYV